MLERALAPAPDRLVPISVTHCSPPGEGWVELLSSGMTFDLSGLGPALAAPPPQVRYRLGIGEGAEAGLEAVALVPGPHMAGGGSLLPVVRAMSGVAAVLAAALGARAVCWLPAASAIEPAFFARTTRAWLEGGPFPALGLTAFRTNPDGSVESCGLAHFTGQELWVEPCLGLAQADMVKLAIRAVDRLVEAGPVRASLALAGPAGEALVLEPVADGSTLVLRNA